jgi:hypothetical protein
LLTQNKVTRLGVDLYPLQPTLLEPVESSLLEEVHLISPPELALLVPELVVILLRDEVSSLEDHQPSIVVPILDQVDKALHAPEPGPLRVLVLVSPRLDVGQVTPVGKRDVDSVERDQEILSVEQLLERADHAGLTADTPREALWVKEETSQLRVAGQGSRRSRAGGSPRAGRRKPGRVPSGG